MLGDNCAGLNIAMSSPSSAFEGTPLLGMMWQCDVCHRGNICDASSARHFFAVLLMSKRDHKRLSPCCEWNPTKIHGCLFHHQQ
jgi:hypothetical protein